MKKIITLLIVMVSLSVTAQESMLLRVKYKKGFKQKTIIEMTQEMGAIKSITKMDMITTTTAIKDGNFITENTFDKIVVDTQAQGQKIHYDSRMKEEDMEPMAKMVHVQMKPLTESVLEMTMNNVAKITDVKVTKGTANPEQFKNITSMVYPKEAIKKGSTWTKKSILQGGIEVNYNYVVKDITKKFVIIDVTGSLDGVAKGDVTGQTTIYLENGAMYKSDVVTNIDTMGTKVKTIMKITTQNL